MTHTAEPQPLRRLRRIALGVIVFYIAIAIIVVGVIIGDVALAVTSVTALVVICILALAIFRRLGRHLDGTRH